jgi:hypothetical protein
MSASSFSLPPVITDLVVARNRLRDHYRSAALEFTLDGNLIGDIGEAVAAELFGLKLSTRNGTGINGHAPDGRSVQVKATGTNPHCHSSPGLEGGYERSSVSRPRKPAPPQDATQRPHFRTSLGGLNCRPQYKTPLQESNMDAI